MLKSKKTLCIAAGVCILLSFSACKKTPKDPTPVEPTPPLVEQPKDTPVQDPAVEIELTQSTYNQEVKAPDGTTALAKAHLNFPKTAGTTEAQMNINAYYDNIMEKQQVYFEQDVVAQAQENQTFTQDNATQFVEFSVNSDFWVACNDGKVLSVVRSYEEFLGGAAAQSTLACDSFSAETGAVLSLSDLFSVPSELYMKRLIELVSIQAKTRKDLYADYESMLESSFQQTDFYLCKEDDGKLNLVLVYQPYSIAPGTVGVIDFELNFEDLKDILKK